MAALRAGLLNKGLGEFHGHGYYQNANYYTVKRYNVDEEIESLSGSNPENSSRSSTSQLITPQKYSLEALISVERHRLLLLTKRDFIQKTKKKIKILDTISTIFCLLGSIFSNIESENYYNNNRNPTSITNSYRLFISISTFLSIFLVCISRRLDFLASKEKRETSSEEFPSFWKSFELKLMVIESIIIVVHCPPWVNYNFTFAQLGGELETSLSELCAAFTLLRVYVLLKILRNYSKYSSSESQKVCDGYGCEASTTFALKSNLKSTPLPMLFILIIISLLVFSVSVRIVERGFKAKNEEFDYSYLWNSMWLVLLTMTTVGYGDFFPRTHIGRFIIVVSCFWGIFLLSLIIVSLTHFSTFSTGEQRAFDYFDKVNSLKTAKKYARLFIRAKLTNYVRLRKEQNHIKLLKKVEEDDMLLKFYYKQFKEHMENSKFNDFCSAELLTMLNERVSYQIKCINRNLEKAHDVHENLNCITKAQEIVKANIFESIINMKEFQI